MAHVLVITLGSRGDVQPFLALAAALRARGFEVTVCTAERFRAFVTGRGLAFHGIDDGILRLLDSAEGRRALEDVGTFWGTLRTTARLLGQAKGILRAFLEDAWAAARSAAPDALVLGSKALLAAPIAEKLAVPAALAMPLPQLVPTGAWPAPGVPRLPLGAPYNRLSYRLIRLLTKLYGGVLDDFRQQSLGLAKRSMPQAVLADACGRPYPILHCYSRHVLPRPDDWPAHASVDGYWFLDDEAAWQPPRALTEFLASGPAPVCVGFGSMAGRNPRELTARFVDALARAGARGVLLTGWGGLAPSSLPPSILPLAEAPHGWLFPRCAAVIHHGGAGTTAAGLRAGRPTLVCPFGMDQPFWGERVHALGAGPRPIPQPSLAKHHARGALTATILDLLGCERYRLRAGALAAQIAAEPGAAAAAARIEALLSHRELHLPDR